MSESPLLAVRGLEKRFGYTSVLKGVDLDVGAGELVLLLGPNGAGKTTLTRIVTLLSRPGKGELLFRGKPLKDKRRVQFRREVGYLSHQSFLYNYLTAEENLKFFGDLYGMDGLARRIPALLEQVGLSDASRKQVGAFSRGMQQRLSMARVLLTDPKLIILDEPYAGLDPEGSRRFTSLLSTLKDKERGVLLITHELDDCLEIADRVAILHKGVVAWEGVSKGLNVDAVKQKYFEVTGAKER
ncbi:MAG: heme ABC exporter ATP-binding protein CcmA [Acidobacteriota bacterium]